MINVKIVKKAKGAATASSGSGGSSSVAISQQGTVNEARHAKQADEATIANRAYNADNADRAAYAGRAGIADRATSLSPDSPEFDKFLRKDIDDTAAGNVTFDQTIDVKGNTTLEGDLDARGSVTHGGTTVHQGQTTHNALARFNQDAEIPADSTERVMGTIKFMAPLSDGTDVSPQERGYINGNGNAQFQTLDVKGRADLEGVAHIHELISEAVTGQAEDFIDGYDGHGLRIWKEEDPVSENRYKWHITADYLTIRQQMKVFELLIQKIRSTGGTIVVSNANGKVKSVSKSVDNTWRLTFETGCDFAVGDIIRCQSWKNMREQGSHVETSAWTGKVYAVQGTGEDAVVIIPDTAEWFSGSTPKEGDECVQWGSTDTARQNIIYITAAEGDNPAVDMLGEVTGPGTGNLHVRIGKLDGIVTGSKVLVPQGWGLYADNAFLKGKFVLENGDDVYQRFLVGDGRLESTISETRALTTGDSIIANPAFLDGFQPWNYYHVTSQLLSDGEVILSDGEKLLSGVGDATKYVGLVTEGMRRFVRIVDNESTDPDIGVEQDVTFMRQVDGKKTVELSFEYRIHTSGDVLITLDSYKNGLVGSLSTEKTSDLYGLQSALVKDGEWHTARVYGTYVSGTGSIQVCAKGNVDLSAFQLYEAVGVQSLSTSINQTSEQIALMATKTELNAETQARTTAVSNLNVRANRIEGVTSKIQFDSNDKITNIDTSGLVTESGYGALFTTNLHNTEGFYDVSYDAQGNPTYTLKLINIQTAHNAARTEISTYRNTQLEQDLTDHNVAKDGDWDVDVNQLRSDTLSTFVSGNEMTAQLSGYYEKDSSGNLVYWTTEDTDYKASDWGNPTSTPTEGKAYFIVAYTKDGVTTHRLAVYDKWKMSDPNNRVVEFVPKFTIKAQISTFLSFKHDANGDPIYARDASGNIIYIDGVPQKEVEGNVMMKADNIIQIAEKIQSVARQMTFTADHIVFNGYVDANGLKIDTEGNVTTFGVVNNGSLTINASNIGNYCTGFSEGSGGSWIDLGGHHFLDVLRCPPTIIINHSSLQSLWLPVAYLRDTDTYTTGQTKFGHDTWQDHTIAEMRSMIGKKLNLYIQDINPESGVYADLLVEVNRHEVDVVSGFPQPGDTISTAVTKTWMCVPTDTLQGVGIGIGKYLTIECKTGVIDNHECIYWEATHSATSLD